MSVADLNRHKGNQHTPGYSGIKIKRPGLLHEKLGVPQGDKIPYDRLTINPGDNAALRKEKQFALNARKFKH